MIDVSVIQELREKILRGKREDWNEENTKQAIISVVLSQLGYDTANPSEVNWEKSVGIKGNSGEKVDLAVYLGSETPEFILESKAVTVRLDERKHWRQLYDYFSYMRPRFAILTNGNDWYFYQKADTGYMGDLPYSKFSILHSSDREIEQLNAYSKENLKEISVNAIFKISEYVDEFIGKLFSCQVPDYLVDKFMEHYNLDSKYKGNVKTEFEFKLRSVLDKGVRAGDISDCGRVSIEEPLKAELEGIGKSKGLGEVEDSIEETLKTDEIIDNCYYNAYGSDLSKEYIEEAAKFDKMINLKQLYEAKDFNTEHLKHLYIFDEPVFGINNYKELFKTVILSLLEKHVNDRDTICEMDIWNTKIAVCYGNKRLDSLGSDSVYNSYYDVTINCAGKSKQLVGKLVYVLGELGSLYGTVCFDIDR